MDQTLARQQLFPHIDKLLLPLGMCVHKQTQDLNQINPPTSSNSSRSGGPDGEKNSYPDNHARRETDPDEGILLIWINPILIINSEFH